MAIVDLISGAGWLLRAVGPKWDVPKIRVPYFVVLKKKRILLFRVLY